MTSLLKEYLEMSRVENTDANDSDAQLQDRSVVLLEELIRTNKDILENNRKLQQECRAKGEEQQRVLR